MAAIYRAKKDKGSSSEIFKPHDTPRLPGNVPYVVDNLWEWKRPSHFPNRRYSAFASPSPDLAIDSVETSAIAHKVEFIGKFNACQLKDIEKIDNPSDSKYHPECIKLKKTLKIEIEKVDKYFFSKPLLEKQEAAALWMPCLAKEEIEFLFNTVDLLKTIKSIIYDSIKYWDDVAILSSSVELNNDRGEIFFEYPEGYRLKPIS